MQREYIKKLFYGKYPYRILLTRTMTKADLSKPGWTIESCRSWLLENNIKYKICTSNRYQKNKKLAKSPRSNSLVIFNVSLFLENKKDFDKCFDKWKDNIVGVSTPYDESHIEVFRDHIEVEIKEKLIYGKYRYIVYFRKRYGEDFHEITNWITSSFDMTQLRWQANIWQPALYLTNEEDLTLVKLTWEEKIKSIKWIRTYDEIASS